MAKPCWLMKSEEDVYSIREMERDGITSWEGVRNYEARNLMRDGMRVGDEALCSTGDGSGAPAHPEAGA